jgi:class 3 adenylate cyclase
MENDLNKSNIESLIVYIPMDRRLAISQGMELSADTHGTALFADISGFTSLTENLTHSLGPQRGAEELTIFLNHVYGALIKELHAYRGSVIGFSGDAITCWFDQDPGESAVTCAVAMQKSMGAFQDVELPGGGRTSISMKAALAYGNVKRFVVGDPDRHIKDVITGNLLDTLAEGEHMAMSGEILLDQRLKKPSRELLPSRIGGRGSLTGAHFVH